MDKSQLGSLNKSLRNSFGFDIRNRPLLRIVWSNDEIEKRFGPFEVYYGHIYLRTETGVREVLKYEYIQDRWILERLFPNNTEATGIIGDTTYEPIYVFQDKNENYLEPNLRVCQFIVHSLLHPLTNKLRYRDEAQARIEKEIKFFEEYLDNKSPYLATMLHNKEAIVVPGSNDG